MKDREIKNAKIRGTFLGYEDHGIVTAIIDLDYGGAGQGFGLNSFGSASEPITDPYGIEFIRQLLDVVEVDSWEKLKGKSVRADADSGRVYRLGNYLKDKWIDPSKIFNGGEK